VFDGTPDLPVALAQVRRNAEACDELRLRVRERNRWSYPLWVAGGIAAEQFAVRQTVRDWREALDLLGTLEQLDTGRMAWRVNVFPPNVVIVQVSHALGDGSRSSALAATLLGRRTVLPPVVPDRGLLPWRAAVAARAHRDGERELPSPNPPRPALSINARAGAAVRRTLLLGRDALCRPTVTVGALTAIGEALGGYLTERAEDVSRLGVEVPMAGPPNSHARNNFRNVNIGLHPGLDRRRQAERIAVELDAQRRRADHPAAQASAAAFATVPAPLLRWGVGRFDPTARSDTVAGHTVVSSVNRGPADLSFGGCPVRFTAGFPALSPMMGLTHGVHGIGDTVAISVHADSGVVDVEDYLDRLAHALGVPPRDPRDPRDPREQT
jgi:hypothetical protein